MHDPDILEYDKEAFEVLLCINASNKNLHCYSPESFEALRKLKEMKFVEENGTGYQITENGRKALADKIFNEFAYLI